MKRNEELKRAWRGRGISLKAWARQQIANDGEFSELAQAWFAAKALL